MHTIYTISMPIDLECKHTVCEERHARGKACKHFVAIPGKLIPYSVHVGEILHEWKGNQMLAC